MKHIKDFDLLPENIIDTFYIRISKKLDQGICESHSSIQSELNRIVSLNGKIPNKIQVLLEKKVGDKISNSEPFKFSQLDDMNEITLSKRELSELIQDASKGDFNSETSKKVLTFLGSSKFL